MVYFLFQGLLSTQSCPCAAILLPTAANDNRFDGFLQSTRHRNVILYFLLHGGLFHQNVFKLFFSKYSHYNLHHLQNASRWSRLPRHIENARVQICCREQRHNIWQRKRWSWSHGGSTRSILCGFNGTKNQRLSQKSSNRFNWKLSYMLLIWIQTERDAFSEWLWTEAEHRFFSGFPRWWWNPTTGRYRYAGDISSQFSLLRSSSVPMLPIHKEALEPHKCCTVRVSSWGLYIWVCQMFSSKPPNTLYELI